MRWVSHHENNHIWWICTWDHDYLYDSRFRVTCAHCLHFSSVRTGPSVTPGCRSQPFGWRPALTRVYCRSCKRVHNPRDLINNRVCDLGPAPHWQKRRQYTRAFYYIYLKIRWASHQDGELLWWFCPLNHPDQTWWINSAYTVTCLHCLRRKGWECPALCDYKCPGPYKWRPKLVRLYCYLCNKIHLPRELINNHTCWRQGISHRCGILHNNILRPCDINTCTVECTDYYKR